VKRNVLSGLLAVGVSLGVSAAYADIPPPDSCSTVSSACDNAGEGHDQPGTCKSTMCSRMTPSGVMEYECLRCELVESPGAAGAGNAPESTPDASTKDGCSFGGSRGGSTLGAWLLLALSVGVFRRGSRHSA